MPNFPFHLPLIVHHMAAPHDVYPPNSLEAIQECLDTHAPFIEIDVTALAATDYLLVHDPVLQSETTGQGEVSNCKPEQTRQLKLTRNGQPTAYTPALLSEVVDLFVQSGGQTRLQIDFKNVMPMTDNEILHRLVSIIEPLENRVIVSTGADWHLRRLHRIAPWLDLGFDIHFYVDWRLPDDEIDPRVPPFKQGAYAYWDDHVLAFEKHWPTPVYLAERCDNLVDSVPFVSTFYIDHKLIARSLDDGFNWAIALHQRGVKLDAWTLDKGNTVAETNARRLLEAGVDQFTTNTPAEMAELLTQH